MCVGCGYVLRTIVELLSPWTMRGVSIHYMCVGMCVGLCLWSVGVWMWVDCVGVVMFVGVNRDAIVTLDDEGSVDSL